MRPLQAIQLARSDPGDPGPYRPARCRTARAKVASSSRLARPPRARAAVSRRGWARMRLGYERFGAERIRTAAETGTTRKRVRGSWHRCDPAAGTLAEAYLQSRGLAWAASCEHVRFRADCPHPS